MKIRLYSLFFLFLLGCTSRVEPDTYLNSLGISLIGDYRVINSESSPAIGDMLVNIELKLGPIDYPNAIKQIKNHHTFTQLDSLELFPSGHSNNPWNEKSEFACYRQGTYYRHLYLPRTDNGSWETYTVYIRPDSILSFQYGEE
jgi:hypothetical protein